MKLILTCFILSIECIFDFHFRRDKRNYKILNKILSCLSISLLFLITFRLYHFFFPIVRSLGGHWRFFSMETFQIPWTCLDNNNKRDNQPFVSQIESTKPIKMFTETLNVNANICNIPTSQLPWTCLMGDIISIFIMEEENLAGLEDCKHNLHGRVIWPKGSTPLTIDALKTKLVPFWKNLSRWGYHISWKKFLWTFFLVAWWCEKG